MKSWIFDSSDYYKENRKTRGGKQSKIPKKPRFEPKSKIIPGKHEVTFERASEIKNADL